MPHLADKSYPFANFMNATKILSNPSLPPCFYRLSFFTHARKLMPCAALNMRENEGRLA